MSLIINDECIACDACREECPTFAIEEGDPIYIIDPDRCTECVGYYDEPACAAACPTEGCFVWSDCADGATCSDSRGEAGEPVVE